MNTTDLPALIEAMPAEQRKGALIVLDALSRPLTVREIEGALRLHGVPRSRAVVLAASTKKLAIISIVGPEQ